jgi:hypothetical protein
MGTRSGTPQPAVRRRQQAPCRGQIESTSGTLLTITGLSDYSADLTAYNLQIDEIHTYYAGTTPVLVHNSCTPNPFRGTNMSDEDSLAYHYAAHGDGRTIEQYARGAQAFADNPTGKPSSVLLKDGTTGTRYRTRGGRGGILDSNGDLLVQVMSRDSFLDAYHRWLGSPFPSGSDDDGLDEIHAQLAYADAMVADSAIPLAKDLRPSGNVPDRVRVELRAAMARLDGYIAGADQEIKGLALTYREYAQLLQVVIDELG